MTVEWKKLGNLFLKVFIPMALGAAVTFGTIVSQNLNEYITFDSMDDVHLDMIESGD